MNNQNKKDDDSYSNSHLFTVFKKFCESSTIHGTYFWTENTNNFWRFFWVGVVITGIVSSGFIINNSFKAWQETPVVTSVAQLAIEEIPFPSITICPLDNNRFGFVEEVIDESSDAQLNKGELLLDIFRLLRTHRFNVFSHSECLFLYCQSKTINADNDDCHQNIIKFEEFYFTMNSFVNDSARYDERIEGMMKDLIRDHFQEGVNEQNARIFSRDFEEGIECDSLVYDYLLLQNLKAIYESLEIKDLNPGKILKWIYYNTKDLKKQSQLMKKYLSPQLFPKAYARFFGANENIPFPDLVTILNGQFGEDSSLGPNFTFSDSLLKAMRSSNHPPHVYENGKFQPDPSMPLCNYAGELSEKATDARIRFCDAFQNTINEDGLCYSFNNNQLGMETLKSTGFYELRKVQGCGKIKGLQLAIDVNKLPYSIISNAQPKGFRIYITANGVVTHKVPFTVDTTFHGEYNFFLHGIHIITSSPIFRAWNKEKKICYYNEDRELGLFGSYTQNNCILECKLNKISAACACSPWFMNQTALPICAGNGFKCFTEKIRTYSDELVDRGECGCKADCEMVHFFSSQNKFSFKDKFETNEELWYDSKTGTGRLASYLLETHGGGDTLTRNLTKLTLGLKDDKEYAQARFEKDIAILNFFFDTPIITEIRLEMKINIFDQISAVGGTLGLFTGVSLVTFVEVTYWLIQLVITLFMKKDDINQVVAYNDNTSGIKDPRYINEYSR